MSYSPTVTRRPLPWRTRHRAAVVPSRPSRAVLKAIEAALLARRAG
ncbi:hypothetical protein [Streptomyces sp. NPDC088789]